MELPDRTDRLAEEVFGMPLHEVVLQFSHHLVPEPLVQRLCPRVEGRGRGRHSATRGRSAPRQTASAGFRSPGSCLPRRRRSSGCIRRRPPTCSGSRSRARDPLRTLRTPRASRLATGRATRRIRAHTRASSGEASGRISREDTAVYSTTEKISRCPPSHSGVRRAYQACHSSLPVTF